MMIPIRCLSCGKPVGHLWKDFQERIKNRQPAKEALDKLGMKRYCCRALFLGHIELIDTVAQYKRD